MKELLSYPGSSKHDKVPPHQYSGVIVPFRIATQAENCRSSAPR